MADFHRADYYVHDQQAIQRPEAGVQSEFRAERKPRAYRYDSSLDPTLSWDENRERELAEWLLGLIEQAIEQGEDRVFAEPQVWAGNPGMRLHSIRDCIGTLKSLTKPFLNWAGKAERYQITVPTLPLFVQERHSTKAILETIRYRKAKGTTLDLFADQQLDIADKLEAYEHMGPWANRLILGDSLQVMNSLLEYEGLGGQVQMIYMDPPYGVKFGSNFQPFVRKRDVKHGKDEDMIREPEMVKAYRDTWELGLHSYLTYLRDRLLLARELLTESGSIFVQISDENLHHVREVMDEVFGARNFVSVISFSKTTGFSGRTLSSIADFLVWYVRDIEQVKFRQIYRPKEAGDEGASKYRPVATIAAIPEGWHDPARLATSADLTSQGESKTNQAFEFNGKTWLPPAGLHWKSTVEGLHCLVENKRVIVEGNSLRFIRFLDDFPVFPISNVWTDIGGVQNRQEGKLYVVQTAATAVQRCLLMTTDPGDLVFDPTCGSGTTAYVAEQWGRRWITCDTSRVPLALARQRLLTATFSYYELKEPQRGPAGGFVYKRKQNRKGEETGGLVPHITLKSIANNEEPKMEILVDRPEVIGQITRVSGPFTVESTIPPAADLDSLAQAQGTSEGEPPVYNLGDPDTYIERMLKVLRQSRTLRLPGNRTLDLENVQRLIDAEHLHAEAIEPQGNQRLAILFGPEDGAVTSDVVFEAHREAYSLNYQQLYIFGFAIQPKAQELVHSGKFRLPCTYIAVTPDVVMSDLLKTTRASDIFSITGLPDIEIYRTDQTATDGQPLYQVELKGLDIFNPTDMETESLAPHNVPMWMLDSDYNEYCFYASQVFFPKTAAWDNIRKALKADYEESVWTHLAGTISEPFVLGDYQRIAVKVIDERGNELMVVKEIR